MSSGTSKRTSSQPYGREDLSFVALANDIAMRTALLFLVGLIRSVMFAVEQPNSTRLFALPYMSFVQKLCKLFQIDFFEKFLWRA